jgi:hypothetical protein
MPSYNVSIAMSQDTVQKLRDGGFHLYAFKAVRAAGNGVPVVWFESTNFSLSTRIQWSTLYEAYTSTEEIRNNVTITAAASYAIDLKQTLNVTHESGTGEVDTEKGTAGAISIHNRIDTEFTCGISQKEDSGGTRPICAFPLYGGNLDVIAPIEKVFLMFSTRPVNTGTVVMQAYSRGVLIDLTGVTSRAVQYDINTGWSAGGASWAKKYDADANLVPLLIESSGELDRMRTRQLALAREF